MFNNKKIIIIGLTGLFLLSIFFIVSFKSIKTKDKKDIKKNEITKVENNTENKNIKVENNDNDAGEDAINETLFEKLKNNHPEFSASQLEFYRETAKKKKGIIVPCQGRDDKNDCIASVAFLKGGTYICGEIEDSEKKNKCVNSILQERDVEITDE